MSELKSEHKKKEAEREKRERQIWETIIEPIAKGYGLKGIIYRFIPFPLFDEFSTPIDPYDNEIEIIKIEREMAMLPNARPFNSFRELMSLWRNGQSDQKDLFLRFMVDMIERNPPQLHHFLEFIAREHEEEPFVSEDKNEPVQPDTINKIFPCPAGTKWNEIEMALLPSKEKYMVKTPNGKGYYDHIDLGLYDNRTKSKRPTYLWVFLNLLAKMKGFHPLEGVPGKGFDILSSRAKRLDNHFRQVFGIKESIYEDRCDRAGGYKIKFKLYRVSDDSTMVREKSLFCEEREDVEKRLNLKEADFYPEHSTWPKK